VAVRVGAGIVTESVICPSHSGHMVVTASDRRRSRCRGRGLPGRPGTVTVSEWRVSVTVTVTGGPGRADYREDAAEGILALHALRDDRTRTPSPSRKSLST
jgi:hypothetical protein